MIPENLASAMIAQKMYRRQLLLRSAAIAFASVLGGCTRGAEALDVRLLKNSIPPQVVRAFRQQVSGAGGLEFKPLGQLSELLELLRRIQGKVPPKRRFPWLTGRGMPPQSVDLVTLGDYWLAEAIREQLLQPLDRENIEGWERLPQRWQGLVRRDDRGGLTDRGSVWGAPYRWGTTLIAYRRDKFESLGWFPQDWQDLWREEVKQRFSLLNQPREVIGLTLKKLGYSYNTTDLDSVPDLEGHLRALDEQVLFYSSDNYLQPLILEDTWMAVGWSADILAMRDRYPQIEAAIPRSGTALWADLWVRPAGEGANNELSDRWIEFCWQLESAIRISLSSDGTSPMLSTWVGDDGARSEIPSDILEDEVFLPADEILDRCEFLLPLSEEVEDKYASLWWQMRGGVPSSQFNRVESND